MATQVTDQMATQVTGQAATQVTGQAETQVTSQAVTQVTGQAVTQVTNQTETQEERQTQQLILTPEQTEMQTKKGQTEKITMPTTTAALHGETLELKTISESHVSKNPPIRKAQKALKTETLKRLLQI